MARCRICSGDLVDGTLFLDRQKWKSCPKCSEVAGVHVFLRFPKDFGWRPTPGGDRIPQSWCTFHRSNVSAPEECRICGASDVIGYEKMKEEVRAKLSPPEKSLSATQLDALVEILTDQVAFTEEGRKYLRKHVATERSGANRREILRIRRAQGPLACDGCDVNLGDLYAPDYSQVIEVHHVVPLARGVQTPRGTDAFKLLCPSCHRVVHHRREDPLTITELRELLA